MIIVPIPKLSASLSTEQTVYEFEAVVQDSSYSVSASIDSVNETSIVNDTSSMVVEANVESITEIVASIENGLYSIEADIESITEVDIDVQDQPYAVLAEIEGVETVIYEFDAVIQDGNFTVDADIDSITEFEVVVQDGSYTVVASATVVGWGINIPYFNIIKVQASDRVIGGANYMGGIQVKKIDPDARDIFEVDWSSEIESDDSIASSQFISSLTTVEEDHIESNKVFVWVSGVPERSRVLVTNRITTVNGRILDKSFYMVGEEQ